MVVHNKTLPGLVEKVNESLADGYDLVGGVCMSSGLIYYQAMVKVVDE